MSLRIELPTLSLICPLLLVAVLTCPSGTGALAEESSAAGRLAESLDLGVVAVRRDDGAAYIGWRMPAEAPADVGFDVFRHTLDRPKRDVELTKLNDRPITTSTNFVDRGAPRDYPLEYVVRIVDGSDELGSSAPVAGPPMGIARLVDKPFISFRFPREPERTFQKVGIADLDGDGRFDFVVKSPNANVDPYEKYWKPSPDTYQLTALSADGKTFWHVDLGWAIERGIWYSPYVVYDLDGDGRAEVAMKRGQGDPRDDDGRVQTGPELLSIVDGRTGRTLAETGWPAREPFYELKGSRGYNYASRNQIGIAYLDGKQPHLIVARGTYNLMVAVAYRFDGEDLHEVWRWDNVGLDRSFQGQGAHWMHAADIDDDGRDEVVLGSLVLDDDGDVLWCTGLGHPDHAYVGDIDPARPGLEIYYGMETRQKERHGMCLVDAATGEIIWSHEGPTRHVHSRGMCADIDARYPGLECYSADTDEQKKYAWSRLRTCTGEVIGEENLGGFGALVAFWDADPQRELLLGKTVQSYGGEACGPRFEGHVAAIADILGDWREEIVVSVPGELRIYTTTIPADTRRRCLMTDPIYRTDVAHAAMGYMQPPMLSGE